MFLIPLSKTIKDLQIHEKSGTLNVAARQKSKVVFVASKVFVLAGTASMSSLLAFILLAVTEDDFVFALDALVNTICLMLLSPYYCGPRGNEHRLYRILCKPCIFICCQQRFSLVYHKVWRLHLVVCTGDFLKMLRFFQNVTC